jgi:hypothetical protein
VSDHQVLFKIVTLRKTLEGLQGLDAKLESILTKKNTISKPSKRIPKDSVEVSEASGEESNLEDYEIEEGEEEEEE